MSATLFICACVLHSVKSGSKSKGPFIWSRVPETITLPPGVTLAELTFQIIISLKNSTNCLHENHELVSGSETTRVGKLSRLGR